ncbi:hypothetical protein DFP73DRAFT_533061 [Morchella snyderi]|nr:hypothetical protein DFP73DRAFT_533061 [Morchella snyderi]
MYRTQSSSSSRFSAFRKPHEILSPSPASPSHSRERNRSSGGSSVGSQGQPNLLVDESGDEADRGGPSKVRSESPPWNEHNSNLIPLLPMNESRGLLSRTPSPYPPTRSDDLDKLGDGSSREWRIGMGSEDRTKETGWRSWVRDGKLGRWLWNTQRGWMVYIGFLVIFYSAAGFGLSVVNNFTLLIGVYKFVYPITTTLFQLVFTQIFLYFSASITRSFSRSLNSLGLTHIIAPTSTPSKGKRRASGGGLRDFARRLACNDREGGVFEFKWAEAKKVIPLAVIHSLKVVLSNISFAYTHPSIYHISRVPSLILVLMFTACFLRNQGLSVTTLSSCITMTLSLAMACLRPGTRFAIEGFLAGIFSTIFVAAYPVLLSKTYKSLLKPSGNDDLLGVGVEPEGKDETRTAWKLLHYTNFISILVVLPWVFLSGDWGDISRNCYILDVPWFWLLVVFSGIGAWGTFVGGFLLVKATTPLTMVVSTYPRTALQTLFMPPNLPTWSWVGVLTCWGSSIWYLLGRRKECGVSFFNTVDGDEPIQVTRGRARGNSSL